MAQVSGRNPMLVFAGQAVIGDAEQRTERNLEADFFAGFADGALLEGFEKIDFTADDAPAASFGRPLAQREQHAAQVVG